MESPETKSPTISLIFYIPRTSNSTFVFSTETHTTGNILDFVMRPSSVSVVTSATVVSLLTDHHVVTSATVISLLTDHHAVTSATVISLLTDHHAVTSATVVSLLTDHHAVTSAKVVSLLIDHHVVTSATVVFLLTDHHAVHCTLQTPKQNGRKKHVSYRKYAAINSTKCRSDVEVLHLITSPCNNIADHV